MAATALARKQTVESSEAVYEHAGATLLTAQPSEQTAITDGQPSKDWQSFRDHGERRINGLQNWRQTWYNTNWNDLATFILPRRSIWLTQSAGTQPSPNNMSRGRPINSAIVDPTATYAARVCAAGLMSGTASVSRPWFKVVPMNRDTELDADGQAWVDDTQAKMYMVLARSNFYNAYAQECEDLVVFGTAPDIIYEDDEDVIRCYPPTVGEYYLSCGPTMRNDGLFRLFVMTVEQIVGFFGYENCPAEIKTLWLQKGNGLDQERIIAHAIEPNFPIDGMTLDIPAAFKWREIYWTWGVSSEKPLSKRGFIEQPFTASVWSRQSNDAYGRSVGMDVLPDVMQLQVMTRRMAEAIEKQVRPPLVADQSLKNQPSSTLPGQVTFVSRLGPESGMRPVYQVMPDVAAMSQNILAIENRIKIGLFNDLFLMLQEQPTKQMTAYEVAQKVQEKMQVLGPTIEGILSDLKQKLDRIFRIMTRKGLIAPKPKSLQILGLDIEFISILALAQKAAATGGIERILGIVGSSSAIFPTAKDNIDIDEAIREYNDLLGNPSKIIRTPEALAAYRQAQAQAAQQQAQMANISQMAEAAGKAAPAAQVLSQFNSPGATGPGAVP